jgi:glycosyltransferase involved in cell wall biosynthesis
VARIALVAHWDWVLYNFRLPLARRLQSRGADVGFVCPPGEYVARLSDAGFHWFPWPISRRGMNPLREAVTVLRLARLYRRERFAAVHHFTIKPVLYGSVAARVAGVRTTINAFTGLGFLFSDARAAARLRPLVLPPLRRLLHAPSVYTVFQTIGDRAHFVRSGLAPEARTTVIASSGVDTRRFAPAPGVSFDDRKPPVVLMASRLLWDKGVGEFVDAARRLRQQGVEARFWIAGEADAGNPRCVPPGVLRGWAQEGIVEFLGHRDGMPDLLRQISIAVLPTYQEGVPRFLLEAAATGLPIVASDIEGCRMVVRPGVNGLLVGAKDAAALADAVGCLLREPSLRERLGRAGREIAVAEFDEAYILDQYEAMYRRLGVIP